MSTASQAPPMRTVAAVLLAFYLAILGVLTFRPSTDDTSSSLRINTRPFATIGPALRRGPGTFSYRVLVGNFLAFIPLGILVPLVRRRSSWLFVILAGFGLSAVIELGQLAVSLGVGYGYRSADIDDVIVNTAGTTAGLLVYGVGRATERLIGDGGS